MEIEAKYKAIDDKFSGLLEIDQLGDYRLGSMEEQFIIDRYMDTADYDILKAGYALRIREKNGKYIATVKGLGNSEGAIHQREEYEMEIQPNTLPQEWSDEKARDIVLSIIHSKPLGELFVIRQFRRIRSVAQNERIIGNMSIDSVDTELDRESIRYFEVEIEIEKDGTLEDLKKLDHIIKNLGLQDEPKSKFQRALEKMVFIPLSVRNETYKTFGSPPS